MIADRDRIDQHDGAVAGDDEVVVRLGALDVELVLETGAAAAFDAHAQHRARRLALQNLADPPRRPFGDRDIDDHRVAHPQAVIASGPDR